MKHITEILDEAFTLDKDHNLPDRITIYLDEWKIKTMTIDGCGYFDLTTLRNCVKFTAEDMKDYPSGLDCCFKIKRNGFRFCVALYNMSAVQYLRLLVFDLKPGMREKFDSVKVVRST